MINIILDYIVNNQFFLIRRINEVYIRRLLEQRVFYKVEELNPLR